MWTWLTKLDPNVIVPTVLAVSTWLWHRVAGEKAKTVEQVVSSVVGAILSEIADKIPASAPIDTWLKGARKYIEDRVWAALKKRGVPRNRVTESFVHAATEAATHRLAEALARERRAKQKE